MTTQRIEYGEDAEQFGILHRPEGESRGVVVVIHGGFWKATYDYTLGEPLAQDLARRGWIAWNIEYRRLGNGGGNPETFADICTAIDHLAQLGLPHGRTITLGHSAGGHLAVWAAGANAQVSGAISQGGVLDLAATHAINPERSLVARLLGRDPQPGDQFDPIEQAPLAVPVRCVHGTHDDQVDVQQARDYVARARAGGGDATLVEYDGGHFEHIDPDSRAWALALDAVAELSQLR